MDMILNLLYQAFNIALLPSTLRPSDRRRGTTVLPHFPPRRCLTVSMLQRKKFRFPTSDCNIAYLSGQYLGGQY